MDNDHLWMPQRCTPPELPDPSLELGRWLALAWVTGVMVLGSPEVGFPIRKAGHIFLSLNRKQYMHPSFNAMLILWENALVMLVKVMFHLPASVGSGVLRNWLLSTQWIDHLWTVCTDSMSGLKISIPFSFSPLNILEQCLLSSLALKRCCRPVTFLYNVCYAKLP